MPFTREGAKFVAFRLGSAAPSFISTVGIGSGSGIASTTDKVLLNEVKRNVITGSPDYTEAQKTTFQGNFNSVEMSGIHLTEFGLFISGPVGIGSVWMRESFGSIVFDGTNELQVQASIDVIPG